MNTTVPGPLAKINNHLKTHDERYQEQREDRLARIKAVANGEKKKTQITFTSRVQYYNPSREHRTLMKGMYRLPWPTTPSFKVRVTIARRYGNLFIANIEVKGTTPWGLALTWRDRRDCTMTKLCGLREYLGKSASSVEEAEQVVDGIYETSRTTRHKSNVALNNNYLGPLLLVLIPLWWIGLILPQAIPQLIREVKRRRKRKKEMWEA